MQRKALGILAAVGLSAAVAISSTQPVLAAGGSGVRPFIALAHPGQVVHPHLATDTNLTAFFLYDSATRLLRFTMSEGDEELLWAVRGPAVPGQVAPEIGFGTWTQHSIEVGPLTRAQAQALKRGRLYLELFQPSALPEYPRAMRGQILPIAGVRY